MKEIWKDIKGYEGYYKISNFGRVLTVDTGLIRDCNNVKPTGNRIRLQLRKGSVSKNIFIHNQVWIHFVGDFDGKIDFKDGVITNCRIDNLFNANLSHSTKVVICKRVLNTKTMKLYESIQQLANELNISHNAVAVGLRKKTKKYLHYKIID